MGRWGVMRSGGWVEVKRGEGAQSRGQGCSFHPYGEPVGWWASSQVSVIPSFTTHDRQIITHDLNVHSLKREMRTL